MQITLESMGFFVAVVLIGIVTVLVFSKLKGSSQSPEKTASCAFNLKPKTFFTSSESVFYKQLLGALHGQPFAIFPKVRLADLFTAHGESRQTAFNKISRKHVDYVIVALPEGHPVLAIELDGPSHASEKQQARDADKDAAFRSAGMPLIRIRTDEKPNLEGLRAVLSPHLMLERLVPLRVKR